MIRRIFKFCLISSIVLGLIAAAVGSVVGLYFYIRLTRDMPQISKLSDYHPKAVTSIYSEDGALLGEVFDDQRRYPVKLTEVPLVVQRAFLAAEDADFYNHPGIDFKSIVRAVWVNLHKKENVQGASTITQQVVKSLLLTREKTYERKAKEAILSYRLEQGLSKDEIFSIYLNEIFFGQTAYGIKAAARVHFRKELDQLTIAEAAFLAGIPKSPTKFTDPKYRKRAIERQMYVLDQLVKHGWITPEQRDQARQQELVFYSPEQKRPPETAYYFDHAVKVLEDELHKVNKNWTPTNPGGFDVYTSADANDHKIGVRSLQRAMREIDKRRGWRGPMPKPEKLAEHDYYSAFLNPKKIESYLLYPAVVKEVNRGTGVASVQVGEFTGTVELKKATWAQRFLDPKDNVSGIDLSKTLKPGQVIEVGLDEDPKVGEVLQTSIVDPTQGVKFRLEQTPDIEGSFVLSNALTGEVKVILGGYDYRRSEFNRATQGLRQPGSSFKPFIYMQALDILHFTPSTIVPDDPISLVAGNGEYWTPHNFDGKFLGPITLRTALQKSRNVVSVYMLNKMGVDKGIEGARKMGITTKIGRDLSISLGTSEVHLIEMVRAYGGFAAGGWLADSLVIKSVLDRNGTEVYRGETKQHQAISEETAFIMAHMMRGVIDRGTATVLKPLGIPLAGKTGTTNDHMDAWFIGYTPEWAGGAWVGFDVKKNMGKVETGGKAAAPAFLYFMQEFLKDQPPLDFDIPDGVVPVTVNLNSGRPTDPSDPAAFVEYFKSGTESKFEEAPPPPSAPQDYLSNDEL